MNSVGTPCFRGYGRHNGERRTKSVCGCIVSQDLSVINLVIVKKGENDLSGLTDTEKPRMRGPKRASKIRKLFLTSAPPHLRFTKTWLHNGRHSTQERGNAALCFLVLA